MVRSRRACRRARRFDAKHERRTCLIDRYPVWTGSPARVFRGDGRRTDQPRGGYDIFSLLLKNRIVFLGTPMVDVVANLIVAQLLYLAQEDPEREVQMYINSPGGHTETAAKSGHTVTAKTPDGPERLVVVDVS